MLYRLKQREEKGQKVLEESQIYTVHQICLFSLLSFEVFVYVLVVKLLKCYFNLICFKQFNLNKRFYPNQHVHLHFSIDICMCMYIFVVDLHIFIFRILPNAYFGY